MAEADRQMNQNYAGLKPDTNGFNLNRDLQYKRELNRTQRNDRQMLESQKAEQFKQGAMPQGLSEGGGLGTGQAWPAPAEKLNQSTPIKDTASKTAQAAAAATQTAGTAMQAGGKGMEMGGNAAKIGGEIAGKGIGSAIGAATGAMGGVVGGPEGMAAGARAGAKTGASIGGKVGKLPGQAMQKAGEATEKAGDKTKSFSRNFRDKLKKSRDEKRKKNALEEKISETVSTNAATAWLLRTAWSSQLSIAGFVTAFWGAFWYLYLLIHFIGAYLTPFSDNFCKFGHEWTKSTGIPTTLKNRTETLGKKLELAEISLFLLLGMFYLFIILTLMVLIAIVIYVWSHPVSTAANLGLLSLKYAWGKVIGLIGL